MGMHIPVSEFTREQRELWDRVTELWALSRSRDETAIRSALHSRYVGWDMKAPLPHDRELALGSVSGDSPQLAEYTLKPLSVEVYERRVGVVHYSYAATVVPKGARPCQVTGRWTEVYVKQGGAWIMVTVSGRPDA
jgi:hypothetical protein